MNRPDPSTAMIELKANARGSLINLLTCPATEEGAVRIACETLFKASGKKLRFQIRAAGDGSILATLPGNSEPTRDTWQDR